VPQPVILEVDTKIQSHEWSSLRSIVEEIHLPQHISCKESGCKRPVERRGSEIPPGEDGANVTTAARRPVEETCLSSDHRRTNNRDRSALEDQFS